jgi:hypothetical protein
VLGIALVGGAALLASGGGDDAGSEPPPATETAAAGESSETLAKRDAGLALAHPSGWKRGERRGIVNLESPDRCVAISLSAPVPATGSRRLFADTVAGLRRTFGKVDARLEPAAEPIGGRPTKSALVAVRTKRGRPVVIRVSVSRGKRFAHLTQVVFRAPPCEAAAEQTRAIVSSIEFSR